MDLAKFCTPLFSTAMVFCYISPNVKHAAIRIYKNSLMDLPNILNCLDISESTFFAEDM